MGHLFCIRRQHHASLADGISFVCQKLMKKCCWIIRKSKYPTQHGENFKVHLLALNSSYSEYTLKLFLLQAENIYSEDPEGAADSEVQA